MNAPTFEQSVNGHRKALAFALNDHTERAQTPKINEPPIAFVRGSHYRVRGMCARSARVSCRV